MNNTNHETEDILFFVSTVGQARNAAALIKQNNLNAIVRVLYTRHGLKLCATIEKFLNELNIKFERFKLPNRPFIPSPGRVRQIEKKYIKTLSEGNWKELWVSNRNTHYKILLKHARKLNIPCCFFEEGLGSYKNLQNFNASSLSKTLCSAFSGIGTYIVNNREKSYFLTLLCFVAKLIKKLFVTEPKEIGRFIFCCVTSIKDAFFQSTLWQKIDAILLVRKASLYFKMDNNFNKTAFVFPEKNEFINAEENIKIDISAAIDPKRIQKCKNLAEKLPTGLYISQKYTEKPSIFYSKVATSLQKLQKTEMLGVVYIRFHPRENEPIRKIFISELKKKQVKYVTVPSLDAFCMEEIVATKHFKNIYGLTSSALIYAHALDENINTFSIADILIAQYKSTDPDIQTMFDDISTIKNFEKIKFL